MYLEPTAANVQRLVERNVTGPIAMLNLLRLRDVADYSSHPELAPSEPLTGRDAYQRYIEHTEPFLTASGGSVLFVGTGGNNFIGPVDERWDVVMLVQQASLDAFFAFASNEDYLAGIGHRVAAVEDSRLLPVVMNCGTPGGPTARSTGTDETSRHLRGLS
jgi:hypothetical protein